MDKQYLWTKLQARIQLVSTYEGKNLNWLFIPGGPGLGSESLLPLIRLLKLPGALWRFDFPGDGSNTFSQNAFNQWPQALIEVTQALENVILVGHSRGGMFALATPEVEKNIGGLVLLTSAPDMTWQSDLQAKLVHFPLPEAERAEERYRLEPTNAHWRDCIITAAPRLFATKEGLRRGVEFLRALPFNTEAFQWAETHFDPTYQARWVPSIPTLILSGEKDIAIPIKYFMERPEYRQKHILLKEIKNAGHFPWLDNPDEVVRAFEEYVRVLISF